MAEALSSSLGTTPRPATDEDFDYFKKLADIDKGWSRQYDSNGIVVWTQTSEVSSIKLLRVSQFILSYEWLLVTSQNGETNSREDPNASPELTSWLPTILHVILSIMFCSCKRGYITLYNTWFFNFMSFFLANYISNDLLDHSAIRDWFSGSTATFCC